MNLKEKLRTSIFILISLLPFVGCEDRNDYLTDRVDIAVDFAVPETGVKSMSGFLHGINADDPADSLIDLLEPKLLRGGTGFYNVSARKARISDRVILALSDLWYNGPGKGFSVMPYDDYDVYREFLRTVIDSTRGQVIYDVWNEPDVGFIWKGTMKQFFECFKITHDVIREELGNGAMISGPSTHWIPEWINGFAKYCNDNQVQLDVFSYHELHETENPYSVRQHLHDLRAVLDSWPNLRVKEIQVNEYGYRGSHHNPAQILGYLYNLEKGGADGACRACWPDEQNMSTCWNGTIGGLLTPGDLLPRTAWWVHRLYAESVSERVRSQTTASFLACFAYRHPSDWHRARVVVANAHRREMIKELRISLDNLSTLSFVGADDTRVNIKVYELPDTGEAPSEGMVLKEETDYTVKENQIEIVLNEIEPLANYVLEISRAI